MHLYVTHSHAAVSSAGQSFAGNFTSFILGLKYDRRIPGLMWMDPVETGMLASEGLGFDLKFIVFVQLSIML